jgi:hypothetical protein
LGELGIKQGSRLVSIMRLKKVCFARIKKSKNRKEADT